jgi:hypothetical protein
VGAVNGPGYGNGNTSGLFDFEWRDQEDVIGFDCEQRFYEEMYRDER